MTAGQPGESASDTTTSAASYQRRVELAHDVRRIRQLISDPELAEFRLVAVLQEVAGLIGQYILIFERET